MAENSSIEWTDTTWNPLAGCTRASAGCDNCYAAVMALRLEAMARADLAAGKDPGAKRKYIGTATRTPSGRVAFNGTINLDEGALREPLSWRKPRRVFVNSMSDLFHKDVPFAFVDKVFDVMIDTPQHTYQVLTKRSERMVEYVRQRSLRMHWKEPPPNIWLGTSVEDQAAADARIPHLLQTPARVRFLSCEPLLGPVMLRRWLRPSPGWAPSKLHWVIVGGESGPGARPMHPQWVRDLRDECQAAGDVAYFVKQMGTAFAGKGKGADAIPDDLMIKEFPIHAI